MWLEEGELTDPERRLCAAAVAGRLLDLHSGDGGDPIGGRRWGLQRTIRAVLLRQLARGEGTSAPRPVAVRVRGARIVGPLNLGGQTLICPLELYECHLDDPVDFAKAEAPGVSLRGSYLHRRLSARGLRLQRTLNLSRGFHCRGPVRLRGARIGMQLDLSGGKFRNPTGDAINAASLRIDAAAFWYPDEVSGVLNLAFARAPVWSDNAIGRSTPTVLRGFRYDTLRPGPDEVGPRERIAWLNRDLGYSPQPYTELARFYRAEGHDAAARRVLVASENRRRRARERRWLSHAWGRLVWGVAGYGYYPWIALLWILALTTIGTLVIMSRPDAELTPGFTPLPATPCCTRWTRCCPSSTSATRAGGWRMAGFWRSLPSLLVSDGCSRP